MTILVMPDGTQRDVPDAEVGSAIQSGAYFPQDAVSAPQAESPSVLEDPVGSLTALAQGAFRGAVPVAGDIIMDAGLDIYSQLNDDYSLYNRVNEARNAHSGVEMAGRILGNVGAAIAMPTTAPAAFARFGVAGSTIATNAAESAIMGAVDQAADTYGEHLLENPNISGEELGAETLRAALWGGTAGAVLGGAGTAAFVGARGAARYADEFLMGGRGAGNAASDAARAAGINSATPDDIANMARNIEQNPLSEIAQAVRRAEAEGVDAFSQRVAREAADEVAPVLREVPRTPDIPASMVRSVVPDGMLEAQRNGMNVVLSHSDIAHRALSGVVENNADIEALSLLNIARQRAASEAMSEGNVASEIQRHLGAYTRLSELSEQMSPAARDAVAPYLSRTNEILTNEAAFGKIMYNALDIQRSNAALREVRAMVESGEALTPQMATRAEAAATFLADVYKASDNKSLLRVAERMRGIAESFKKVGGDLTGAQRVADVSRELARSAEAAKPGALGQTGALNSNLARAAGIGLGYKLGGWPGGLLARELFRGSTEIGYRRAVLWRAQNAYARFRGRTAESLLRFAQNPRPRPAHIPTSQEAYEAAIDSIKRASDMPTSYNTPDPHAKTMPPPFVANWVEPRTVPISATPSDMLRAQMYQSSPEQAFYKPGQTTLDDLRVDVSKANADSPITPSVADEAVTIPPASRDAAPRPARSTQPPTARPGPRAVAVDESAVTAAPTPRARPVSRQARAVDEYMAEYSKRGLSEKMSKADATRHMRRAIEILGDRQPTTRNIEHALMTARSEAVRRSVTMSPIGE